MRYILSNSRKGFLKTILFLGLVGLIGGIVGFVYGLFEKPNYESNLTFALDEGGDGSSSMGIAGIAAQFGLSLGSNSEDVFGGENITEIMKSRRIIENVLLSNDTLNGNVSTMADYYDRVMNKSWRNKAGIINVNYPVGLSKNQFNYLQDSILYCMFQEIQTGCLEASRPDKKLNIFEIKFRSPDERFTKIFTDKILLETSQFYTKLRTKKSQQTVDVLEARVAELKESLYGSLSIKAGTQDANTNTAFASGQVPLQKQQLNIQAYGGAYGELYKNLELARYQLLKEVPLLQVIDPADYPMKRVKASKLKLAIYFSIIAVLLAAILMAVINNFKKQDESQ